MIMLVPVKMNIRSSTVCTSLHEGRQVNKATLPIHIDQLFTLLFTNSKFFLDFHTARKTTGNTIIIIALIAKRNKKNINFRHSRDITIEKLISLKCLKYIYFNYCYIM